jgi:hypothetical protein
MVCRNRKTAFFIEVTEMEQKELEQALQDLYQEHNRVMAMCEILARIVANHEKRLNSTRFGEKLAGYSKGGELICQVS